MELFSSRSRLIKLESDILNLEKRKYSLDDEKNRYIIGAIKGKVEAIFGVKNGTAEIVINIVDKRDFDLEFGNSIKAFIILNEVNLYEYIYEIVFPYFA
ncbi:hypothetical protein [Photorhabdus australis]